MVAKYKLVFVFCFFFNIHFNYQAVTNKSLAGL